MSYKIHHHYYHHVFIIIMRLGLRLSNLSWKLPSPHFVSRGQSFNLIAASNFGSCFQGNSLFQTVAQLTLQSSFNYIDRSESSQAHIKQDVSHETTHLMPNGHHGGPMDCVQFGHLKVASISDTTTVQKVSRWAHKNGPIVDHHFVFLYHSCMPGPSYYFFQPLAGYYNLVIYLCPSHFYLSQRNPIPILSTVRSEHSKVELTINNRKWNCLSLLLISCCQLIILKGSSHKKKIIA